MKKRALKSPSIDWIILQGLSFPYQTMPTWNAIGLDFVKKPSMPHPAKSLIYIYIYIYISNAAAQVAGDLLKALAILSDITVRRSLVDRGDLKPN